MLGTSFRKNYHHIDQIFPRAFLNYLFEMIVILNSVFMT